MDLSSRKLDFGRNNEEKKSRAITENVKVKTQYFLELMSKINKKKQKT